MFPLAALAAAFMLIDLGVAGLNTPLPVPEPTCQPTSSLQPTQWMDAHIRNFRQGDKIKSSCRVTSYSIDGIGHQMEAKITRMGVAVSVPGFEYIHMPIESIEHIAVHNKTADYESFFNFQNVSKVYSARMGKPDKDERPKKGGLSISLFKFGCSRLLG